MWIELLVSLRVTVSFQLTGSISWDVDGRKILKLIDFKPNLLDPQGVLLFVVSGVLPLGDKII